MEEIKLYVTGDTHGYPAHRLSRKMFHYRSEMNEDDAVAVLGDHGLNFSYPRTNKEELNEIKLLSQKYYNVLLLDGNHDNHDWLEQLPVVEKYGGKVGKLFENVYTLKRGEIYTINNKKIFCFGGAISIDKEFRKERLDWWPQEIPSEEEFNYALDNLAKHDFKVDIVLTHTCPESFIRQMRLILPHEEIIFDKTSHYLDNFLKVGLQFESWYFAHWHVKSKVKDSQGRHLQCLYDNFVRVL